MEEVNIAMYLNNTEDSTRGQIYEEREGKEEEIEVKEVAVDS